MAEQIKTLEREYTIPLRRHWLNVPEYRRAGKAVKTIKIFIAKHMKVPDRNVDNVKLDVHFNNEIWFRGKRSPPSKVRVKAIKEGDIVKVSFVTTPENVVFLKNKMSNIHKKEEKKAAENPIEEKKEKKEEIKSEEQKKDESEKEKSVEKMNIKDAEIKAREDKHVSKVEKTIHPHRMALKK